MEQNDSKAQTTAGNEKTASCRKEESRRTGFAYEKKAAEYLAQKGYRILKQNFYTKFGEIDVIARDGRYLVFVEVKYRSSQRGGHPLETVDGKKQNRIKKAALFYLLRYGLPENTPCRFDVVGILGDQVVHIENAFM